MDEKDLLGMQSLDGIFGMGRPWPRMHRRFSPSAISKEMSVLRNILRAKPELAQARLKNGDLPLHDLLPCVGGESAAESTRLLLLAHPAAAEERDSKGRLPLHVAVERCDYSEECVRLLLQAYPAAAQERSADGSLPLHMAVFGRATEGCIRLLLHANPAAAEKSLNHSLPLRIAFTAGKSPTIIWHMAAAFKGGWLGASSLTRGAEYESDEDTRRTSRAYAPPSYKDDLLEELAQGK
jgi:ankyrin repeat protein